MTPTVGRQRRRRPTEETRTLVLDAAETCFTRFGAHHATIDDIVREAGVPRATLYRHAGSRDELLLAVTVREIDRIFEQVSRHLTGNERIDELIVDGVVHILGLVRSSTLLSSLANTPGIIDGAIADGTLAAVLDRLEAFVERLFSPARDNGLLRSELSLEQTVELLTRTVQSHLTGNYPVQRSEADLKDYLRNTLVPALVPDHVRAHSRP